jgi:AcrR family transcriptional regulator
VSRWAPNSRERLENAALDLFAENGYEETTVAQIAERAGMNRATFFRHFADKREVLFGGEDVLAVLFADAIRATPPEATLAECLRAALRRRLVAAGNTELQERALLKHARVAQSIAAALRERGTDELTARLGAETGLLAFTVAFERWMQASGDAPFPPFADEALGDLRARAAELVVRPALPRSPLPTERRARVASHEGGEAFPAVSTGREGDLRPERNPRPGHVAVLRLDHGPGPLEGRPGEGRVQLVELSGGPGQVPGVSGQLGQVHVHQGASRVLLAPRHGVPQRQAGLVAPGLGRLGCGAAELTGRVGQLHVRGLVSGRWRLPVAESGRPAARFDEVVDHPGHVVPGARCRTAELVSGYS